MAAATDAWANGVIGDAAKAQAAIDALHGETINIGVDAAGIGQTAAATDALNKALADVAASNAANAAAAQDNAGATTAVANSAIFATQAMGLATIGFGIAHIAITALGANIVADTIGFTAFGIAAVHAIGPVVTSLSTLTTSYGALDNYQRAAALSLKSFLTGLGGGNEPQVFTVFNQALDLIKSHMGGAAGVTSQASIAFMDFFAMLKQQFASSGWTAMFSRSTGVIRTDMDALFGLFNNLIGLVPAVFHDFNGLGLGVIGFASGLLHATAAVLEFNPALTKTIAGVSLAATAWHLLGNSISWVPAMGPTLSKLGTSMAATYQGARLAGMGMGEASLAAVGLTGGLAAATAIFGVAAAGLVAYAFATRNVQTPVEGLIGSLTAQDQAVGDNAAGYAKLSQQLGTYASTQRLANIGVVAGGHDNANLTSSFYDVGQASQQAAQTASTLRTNFGYLESTYNLTRQQAYQLAQATGVNLKQALTGSSTAAVEARGKIATYEQTMATAAGVESQFAYDMQQATNKTLTMTDRLQGLAEAFTVLSGPLLAAMSATATFKQQQDALSQAVKTDGTEVGVNTQRQAALTLALAQAAHGAMQASTAILNNTQSARAAAGPLMAMRDEILDLGLKGAAAAALIGQLNAEINALHSKTVTITTIIQTLHQGGASAPTRPGYASGTTSATAGLHPLAEQGAELVTQPGTYAMQGGEHVYNAAQTRAMLGGTTVNVTVNVAGSVLADQDLRAQVQTAVLDAWTRTGSTGFTPYGHQLR